jgi:glycosyltransferase 2 family protein
MRPPRRRGWLRWFNLLVVVGILAALAWWVDLREVGGALLSLTPGVLVIALLLATADRFLMTWKWRQLVLAGAAPLRFLTALRIHYQAAASGRVVPTPLAADMLRAWLASQARVPDGVVVSSIVLERLVGLLVSFLAAFLGLAYLTGRLPEEVDQRLLFALLGLGLLAGLGGLALLLLSSAHGLGARLYRRWSGSTAIAQRLGRFMHKVSAALLHYRSRRGALLINGLLGVVEYALQLAKWLVLGAGLGIGLPAMTFMAIIALMLVVRRISGNMDSWGLGEGSAAVVLVLLGVDAELAIALLLANFAVGTVAVLPGAVLFYTHPVSLPAGRASLPRSDRQGDVPTRNSS